MLKKLLFSSVGLGLLFLASCGFQGGPLITQDTFASHKIRHGGDFEDTAPLSLKVDEALKLNPRTMHSKIKVSTFREGAVKLSGFVNSNQESQEAERIAYAVDGVRNVANALFIR